jgi:hypothetical protein
MYTKSKKTLITSAGLEAMVSAMFALGCLDYFSDVKEFKAENKKQAITRSTGSSKPAMQPLSDRD